MNANLCLQGYHDVAVTLVLVTGEDLATALLEQISLHQLRYNVRGCIYTANSKKVVLCKP